MATKTTKKKKTAKTTRTWQEAAAKWRAEMDAWATRDELAVVAKVPNTPEGLYLRWRIASIGESADAWKMRDGIPFEKFYERLWRPFLSSMNTALWMLEGEDGLDVTQDDLLGAFRQTNAADWIKISNSLSCLKTTEADFASNDIPPEVEPTMRWLAYVTERASEVVHAYIEESPEIAENRRFFREAERRAREDGIDIGDPASIRQYLTEAMAEYSAARCKAGGIEYKLMKIPRGESAMLDAARAVGNELAAAAVYREHAAELRDTIERKAHEKELLEQDENEIIEMAEEIALQRRDKAKGKPGRPYEGGKGADISKGANDRKVKIIDAARDGGLKLQAAISEAEGIDTDPASYARQMGRWRLALCEYIPNLPQVGNLINRANVPDPEWAEIKAKILNLGC